MNKLLILSRICSSTDLMTHPFIALLSKMLRMNPSTRPSSENCFQEATRTGMVSPGDLKEDKTSNDDNTSDPITAEVLKPELASPNAPTPIVSGTNRVPGAKRDPSPTGPDQTPADKPNKSNNPTVLLHGYGNSERNYTCVELSSRLKGTIKKFY
ncbi:AGC family protein kinase [Histoplasma capsulatum var. duboisii H88]|uniref:AGC family protein kinase n=1 Tax=Ajellomyces capsulatus (strain H88) TaxID=544711 RepID=A0A8A1L7U6_AJEC8|nr:AGC family protein kinase [Histoplasma capsulatum var. duboisii H88]